MVRIRHSRTALSLLVVLLVDGFSCSAAQDLSASLSLVSRGLVSNPVPQWSSDPEWYNEAEHNYYASVQTQNLLMLLMKIGMYILHRRWQHNHNVGRAADTAVVRAYAFESGEEIIKALTAVEDHNDLHATISDNDSEDNDLDKNDHDALSDAQYTPVNHESERIDVESEDDRDDLGLGSKNNNDGDYVRIAEYEETAQWLAGDPEFFNDNVNILNRDHRLRLVSSSRKLGQTTKTGSILARLESMIKSCSEREA